MLFSKIASCIKDPYHKDNVKWIYNTCSIIIITGTLYILYLRKENAELKSLQLNNIIPYVITREPVKNIIKESKELKLYTINHFIPSILNKEPVQNIINYTRELKSYIFHDDIIYITINKYGGKIITYVPKFFIKNTN